MSINFLHNIKCISATLFMFFLTVSGVASSSDTLRIDLQTFIRQATSESAMLAARKYQVQMAENRVGQARTQRIFPRLELTTAHGLVPGVTSNDADLPRGQYYLDPNLRNDWYDWGIFTRAEVTTLQPIYTWGAISNAIEAAKQGVTAAQSSYEMEVRDYEIRLYELYYAMLLSYELKKLVDDARKILDKAEQQLDEMLEDGDQEITEADVFQLKIFKYDFLSRVDEVNQTIDFLHAAWNIALNNVSNTVYLPMEQFLDPLDYVIQDVSFYEYQALSARPEVAQVQAAYRAARYGLDANKSAYYPSLFMAFSGAYARTPNRPRQDNPFIINSTNYESIRYGFGIRQNLNFAVTRNAVARSEMQVRQANYARQAVDDGVKLDIRDNYRRMMMSYSRLSNNSSALQVSAEWLRMEQIDYDLGFGEVKNLIDAVKSNLELEVSQRQRIFDFNVNVGKLNKAAGLPIAPVTVN